MSSTVGACGTAGTLVQLSGAVVGIIDAVVSAVVDTSCENVPI